MLSIFLFLALAPFVTAYKGSSAWFYTGRNCTVMYNTANPNKEEWSMELGIDRGTCWKREYAGDPRGARRRSIRIDPQTDPEDREHCLWMYWDTICEGKKFRTMSFTQHDTMPICYTFDHSSNPPEIHDVKYDGAGYASYWITKGKCQDPSVKAPDTWLIPNQW